MVRIVSSTHSCVKRFPQMLWFLLVSGVMAEADSGKTDQTSVDADAIRVATERLQAHLPVAKGKVAPFLATRGNELKVVVNVSVAVFSVLNINDAQQTMTSRVGIPLSWHDKALSWNTSDSDGVEMVEMPVDSVWTPHMYISNSLDMKNLLADVSTVAISHDGFVATFLESVVETMCNLNLNKYPYDTQNCPLNIYNSHLVPGVELQVGIYFFRQSWSESLSYSCEWYLETQKTEIVSVNGMDCLTEIAAQDDVLHGVSGAAHGADVLHEHPGVSRAAAVRGEGLLPRVHLRLHLRLRQLLQGRHAARSGQRASNDETAHRRRRPKPPSAPGHLVRHVQGPSAG